MHRIKISQVVKKVIEEDVRRIEEKNLSENHDNMGRILRKNTSKKEIVKAARSSRSER